MNEANKLVHSGIGEKVYAPFDCRSMSQPKIIGYRINGKVMSGEEFVEYGKRLHDE